MPESKAPIRVDAVHLGSVRLPSTHPRAGEGSCPVRGAVVRHPDGVIVVDTGTADDHPLIAELYRPHVVPLVDALNGIGVDERDVVAIVNSHLHFDHCGQNRALPEVPVWVQRAELALVDEPTYTVAEWARTDAARVRSVDGDATVTDGVRVVATPGHTPGHQSVVVDTTNGVTVVGGQCCYDRHEFDRATMAAGDAHDDGWVAVGIESVRRLRDLRPTTVHLAHDPEPWRPR